MSRTKADIPAKAHKGLSQHVESGLRKANESASWRRGSESEGKQSFPKGLLLLQEYEERTDKVRKLKEEFANASSGLQTLTSAVEKKKVREINAVML